MANADIKARLKPDGSNFEEIARLYSDDTKTGKDGGILQGVHRYDDRLPDSLLTAEHYAGSAKVPGTATVTSSAQGSSVSARASLKSAALANGSTPLLRAMYSSIWRWRRSRAFTAFSTNTP